MPRSHWKSIPLQIGLTAEALHKLRRVVLDVEDSVTHDGVLKHTHLVHWATYYLVDADREDVIRILKAGKKSQESHETRAESGVVARKVLSKPQANEPAKEAEQEAAKPQPEEVKPPESPSVSPTTSTVWTRGKKPGKGDSKGLDRDRPTGRKMSKTPRRK